MTESDPDTPHKSTEVSFHQLAETSPIATIKADKNGEIAYANSKAEEVLGLEKSEITDRTYDDPDWKITAYDGSPYPTEKLPFEIVKRNGKPVENVGHAIEWPDGGRKLLSVNASPLFADSGVFDGMVALIQDITEQKELEESQHKLIKDLGERCKELKLLYNVAELSVDKAKNLDDILQETVNLIPPAWNYPDITCARITYKDTEYRTNNFATTDWGQTAHIEVGGKDVGQIEIYYLEERPEVDEEPFLKAERNLIHSLSHMLSQFISRLESSRQKEHLNSALKSIRNVNQLLVKEKDRDKLIKGVCNNLTKTRGYYNVWIALFDSSGKLITIAQSGLGDNFKPMRKLLEKGQLPTRVKETLNQSGVVVTEDPSCECNDCPLSKNYEDRGALTVRLEYNDSIYGILSVSIPGEFIDDEEEHNLIGEVARDIAFGLHDIEIEKKNQKAQREIRRSEKRFRGAVKLSPSPMMIHAEDGEVITVNDVWIEITGYDKEEISTITEWTKKAYGEKENNVRKDVEKLYKLDERIDEGEYEITTKDGANRIWSLSSAPVGELLDGRRLVLSVAHDVTARKQAEQEVERQRDRAQRYLDIAGSIIVLIEENGKVTKINQAGCELLGYERDEIVGKEWYVEFVPERVRKELIEDIRKPLMQGKLEKAKRHENPIITKDAEERIIAWDNSLVREDEKIIGTLSSGIDITDRVKVQEKLRENEKKYRTLFENTGTATVIIEKDTTLSLVNEQFEQLSGYSREAIENKMSWTDFVAEEDLERMNEYHYGRRENSGVPNQYEFTFIDRKGNSKDILLAADIIEGAEKSVASLLDITRRKQAEKKIREDEKRFRSYVENSPFGIFIANENGDYVEVNKSASMITSYKRKELLDMNIVDLIPDSYKEEVKASFKSLSEQKRASSEVPFVRKDGTKRYWALNAVRLSKGRFLGFVEDITERKQLEKQIKNDRDEIQKSFVELAETTSRVLGVRDPYTQKHEQRVAELAREVGRRIGLAKDKLLGLYIGGLLHDIGKIVVPETILTKPGELNDIEWDMIKSHPEVGYHQILKDTDFPWPVAEMTLHHHERLDGSGYPDGIEGDQLTTEVRILSAVDVVEAMSTRRPYRRARTKKKTLNEIKTGKGTKYDPEVVDILVDMIEEGEIDFGGK